MRDANTTLVKRDAYTAPAFFIRNAELVFDLEPAKTIVSSKLTIERNPAAPADRALRLNGEGLTLLWPELDLLVDSPRAEIAHHAREALVVLSEDMSTAR